MAKAAVTRSIRDDHRKNFLKIFNSLTGKHSRWEIWEDFVTLTAIEISNSTDKVNAPERTKMYQTIVSKYSAKEREGMAEMLGEVIMGMEQNPDQDFLGSLYMMCELGNDHAGQFFTPYDVCRCMAEITFDPKLHPDMEGFISVSDPACGAGATLLAFLNVCKRRNICYHNKVLVIAQDIDFIVGLMCYISKYQNIVQDGRAYSLGGVDPAASLDMDHARQYCEAKGEGWHLMTRMEWGLIQRMCEAAGFVPKGNNNYGRHDSESFYKAIPTYMSGDKIGRVATGTGPLTWYHDNSPSGISGLTGNVWEWMGAVRSVYGEIQFLVNNNGADSAHSQSPTSTEWKAISCVDGSFITPDGKGTTANSVKIDIVGGKLQWAKTITHKNANGDWPSCTFGSITCSADIGANAKLLLQALGMMPYSSSDLCAGHTCWFRNSDEERAFFSGCSWRSPSVGLGSFCGRDPRSGVGDVIGFRAAYCKLPSVT